MKKSSLFLFVILFFQTPVSAENCEKSFSKDNEKQMIFYEGYKTGTLRKFTKSVLRQGLLDTYYHFFANFKLVHRPEQRYFRLYAEEVKEFPDTVQITDTNPRAIKQQFTQWLNQRVL